MAYVTGFEQDVFISFTHDDNLPFGVNKDGWVALFERALTGLLIQRLPQKREVKVWRDPKLHSNNLLEETLDATVSRAAVLVCVMSARYLGCAVVLAASCRHSGKAGIRALSRSLATS